MSEQDWVELINAFTLTVSIVCGVLAISMIPGLWRDRPWK